MAGGNGGGHRFNYGKGGTGHNGQSGTEGYSSDFVIGGGGGGSAGGGAGGDGAYAGGGTGGAGGAGGNQHHLAGYAGKSQSNGYGAGGGGGGGANGLTTSGRSISSTITGGAGGRGGNGFYVAGSEYAVCGGGGGAGGYGVVFNGAVLANTGAISGGAGGNGGFGYESGGSGGDGGVGLDATAKASIANRAGAKIVGGRGGDFGKGRYSGKAGHGGVGLALSHGGAVSNAGTIRGGDGGSTKSSSGGAGITGANLTVANTGTIAGGFSNADGTGSQADAIDFTGGSNALAVGGTISGDIALDHGASLSIVDTSTLSNDVRVTSSTGTFGALKGKTVTLTGALIGDFGARTGTRIVLGSAQDTGTIVFEKGSRLSIAEATFAAGTDTFAGGSRISVSTFDIDGATVNIAAGRNYRGTFDLDAGTLNLGRVNFNLHGATELGGGTIGGQGNLGAYGATRLDKGTIATGSATLIDAGTLTATAGLSLQSDADLFVTAAGTYDLDGNVSIGARTANNAITNQGLIEKTAGIGTAKSTISAAIDNNGTIDAASGRLNLTGEITGTGTLTISGNSAMELGALISSHQTAHFGTGNGHLELDAAAEFHATISGFGAGDAIALKGFDDHAKVLYEAATGGGGGTLSVTDGSKHFATHVDGSYNANGFSLTHNATGETIHYTAPAA